MQITVSEKVKNIQVDNPEKLAEILVDVLKAEQETDRVKEHFWGIYFNSRQNIKRIELITLGIINSNLVHPRETYCPAIESAACSLVVVHNHPSGDVQPSEADLLITKRLEEAGKILGVDLLDHLIISEEGKYFSFRKEKLIL